MHKAPRKWASICSVTGWRMEDTFSSNYRTYVLHWTLNEPPSVTHPPLNQLSWCGLIRTHSMSWGYVSPLQIPQLQGQHVYGPLLCSCHVPHVVKQVTGWAKPGRQGPSQRGLDCNSFWTHLRHITFQRFPQQYIPSYMLFLSCDIDSVPLRGGVCFVAHPLNLGKSVIMVEVTLCDFQGSVIKNDAAATCCSRG